MMSVDKVQSKFLTADEYKLLTEEQKTQYALATSRKEKRQLTIQFRQAADKTDENLVKGTVVEKEQTSEVTPEEKLSRKERKEAARAAKEAEIAKAKAAAKEYADSLYAPKELDEYERSLADAAVEESGKNRPLYKNRKARRELRNMLAQESINARTIIRDAALEKAETEELKTQIQEEYASEEKFIKKAADSRAKDIAIGDRIEHTRVFDSRQDKRAAKKRLGDEADGLRLKVHNKTFIGEDNANLHNIVERDGVTRHEAAMEIADGISGDRRFEPNEAKNFAAKSSDEKSYDAAARQELKAMGFEVKDDTWKNLAKGLGVATVSALGASALPIIVDAFADAIVVNSVTGETLAYDSAPAERKIHNWKGGAIGGIVGGAVATALFGGTQDEDVLHGVGVQEIFKDVPTEDGSVRAYENMSFGSKDDTEKVKLVLRAIDAIEATDGQKTQFLREAAGENGQQILSKKELVLAYMKAADAAETEDPNKCPEIKEVTVPEETTAPESKVYETEFTTENHEKRVQEQTGLKHKPGLYADTIVRKGYERADGKPLSAKQIKEIRDTIQRDNEVNKRKAVPDVWILNNEITLADGTVAKLKPQDELEKIKPELSDPSKIGLYNNQNKPKEQVIKYTTTGFVILERQDDGSFAEVPGTRQTGFPTMEEAKAAARLKLAELQKPAEES